MSARRRALLPGPIAVAALVALVAGPPGRAAAQVLDAAPVEIRGDDETPCALRAPPPPTLELAADGSLLIQSDGQRFAVASAVSVPGGGWLRLGSHTGARPGEKAVRPRVKDGKVHFKTDAYALDREVR